ncbi:MAG: hypothetical protein IPJ32_19215 [Sphingobacteriaceae bacterium]|jgi:hypothetical protein|nr:hypothetical protein [Sphingobacteriaceae bacterium]
MKRVLIIVLFAIAIGLTYLSITPYNSGLLLLAVPMMLLFFGLLMAFFLTAWNSGQDFKERFMKGLNLGLMLSSGFYILGYIFVIVESLIRS